MDQVLTTAFLATRELSARADGDQSFFEKNKTMIIAAGIGLPIQIIAGFFYLRYRKKKKAAIRAATVCQRCGAQGEEVFSKEAANHLGPYHSQV